VVPPLLAVTMVPWIGSTSDRRYQTFHSDPGSQQFEFAKADFSLTTDDDVVV
jgi:hypothetical protein